jgi:hypothetical protein
MKTINERFDEKIGYCTRSECVDLNEVKSFISQTISNLLTAIEEEVENIKSKEIDHGVFCDCPNHNGYITLMRIESLLKQAKENIK